MAEQYVTTCMKLSTIYATGNPKQIEQQIIIKLVWMYFSTFVWDDFIPVST